MSSKEHSAAKLRGQNFISLPKKIIHSKTANMLALKVFTLNCTILWVIFIFCLSAPASANSVIELAPDAVAWRNLAPGFDILELALQKYPAVDHSEIKILRPKQLENSGQEAEQGNFVILRSDPKKCAYSLHMASEDGNHHSLLKRAQNHNLYAAINAGMFLPDNLKNTGFMRNAAHVNNGRIVSNFGAFFMAGTHKEGLPQAVILEKSATDTKLKEKIADYDIVIQNYRLINSAGNILWPESQETHSISALSADENGNILFIFCKIPLSAADFSRVLLVLPLGIRLTMYLEGGVQAGLVSIQNFTALRLKKSYRVWQGVNSAITGLSAFENMPLPNVLGVFPRAD